MGRSFRVFLYYSVCSAIIGYIAYALGGGFMLSTWLALLVPPFILLIWRWRHG